MGCYCSSLALVMMLMMVLELELLELGIWEQNTAVSADFADAETCCCSKAKPDAEIKACSSAADPKSNILATLRQ